MATPEFPADMPPRAQFIDQWKVVAGDKLTGLVYNRPNTIGGSTIVTQRVLQVQFIGRARTAVAFTASGVPYWLGYVADSFDLAEAEAFIHRKMQEEPTEPMQMEEKPELSLTLVPRS
jgi:hypothetical protein